MVALPLALPRIGPLAVGFDELDETRVGFGGGDAFFDAGFADVEIDLSRGAADVAEVGVGHLARAVDDTAHDRDLDAFEMAGLRFDALGRALQIKERATAGGTRDVFGFRDANAGTLQDVIDERQVPLRILPCAELNTIAQTVAEERA